MLPLGEGLAGSRDEGAGLAVAWCELGVQSPAGGGLLRCTHTRAFLSRVRGSGGAVRGPGISPLLPGFLSRGDKRTDQASFTMAEDWQQPECPGTGEELWARSPSGMYMVWSREWL